jgi:pimeloyl-ACP methyl ester carboxylesterase
MKTKLLTILLTSLAFTAPGQQRKVVEYPFLELENAVAVTYKTALIDSLHIFYREAGDRSRPTILFLHGFPSSSHMYREILRDLSPKYHVIAPDYPGFGMSDSPTTEVYQYTFDNIAATMMKFINVLKLDSLILYVQDYGGPIGFRIASTQPKLVQGLVIQNANAYIEGLGEAIAPMKNYFNNPNDETEKGAREIFNTTKWQYTEGAGDLSKISPDGYTVDQFYLNRPGNDKIQLALFRDYKNNITLYDGWQSYFRKMQPPTLVIWGRNDKIFIAPGGEAYKKDLKDIEVHMLNGGHFVLEEHHFKVAEIMDKFISKKILR